MSGGPGVPLRRPSRPTLPPNYHVRIKNRDVRADWDRLVAVIGSVMTRCWDHLAMRPGLVLPGGRCHRLKGAHLSRTWHYKPTTGHNYRIWYGIDEPARIVLVTRVWATHP